MTPRYCLLIRFWCCLIAVVPLSGSGRVGAIHSSLPTATVDGSAEGKWPKITGEIWSLKASDFPDRLGAVILHDRYQFRRRSLERFRRILVMAESGRAHTDFQIAGEAAVRLEGRTITSDNAVTPFVPGRDLLKTVLVSTKRGHVSALKIIPPGVTGHCIIDVSWSEPIDAESGPIPESDRASLLISLSGRLPVKLAEVHFDWDLADIDWIRKFEVLPNQKFKQLEADGQTTFLFENIPAREVVSLASEGEIRTPFFTWFWAPPVRDWLTSIGFPQDQSLNLLDAAACTIIYTHVIRAEESTRWLRNEFKQMAKGIEAVPVRDRVTALIRALRDRVKTFNEVSVSQDANPRKVKLEAVLKRGWGTADQLNALGFHLLRECGLDVSLVMAIDREDNRLGDPNNIWQYDHLLLSVPDGAGGTIYLNPGSRFAPLSLPSWVHGSLAMVVHPGKKQIHWTAKIQPLPSTPPEQNEQIWDAKVTPAADSDDFEVSFAATGQAASSWRAQLFAGHPTDVQKALTPLLEQPGFRIRAANGPGVFDPWKNLGIQFEGTRDHDGGRRRLVQPFTFLRAPFSTPRLWPELRTLTIHLPMKTAIQARTRIAWKGPFPTPQELEPILHQNDFGSVSWSTEQVVNEAGEALIVNLKIRVEAIIAPARYYEQLRVFSGWIQEVLERGVPAPRL